MIPSANESPTPGITRREAIRRAALLAGVALSPGWLTIVDQARASAQAASLSTGHVALTSAIAERILPRTDTPGAVDVGVPAFINRLYGEFMTEAEQRMLTGGLDAVESASTAAHRAPFVSLTSAQQDALLKGIAKAEEAQPQGFFRLFRAATVLGYFTSEQVGKNVLHYDPVPGRYDACVPMSEVGNRNWTT